VRGVSDAVVLQAIDDHTSDRTLGVLGEKTIDVLALNRALDGLGT
jgi:K+-transporting ATPase c subunit